MAMCTLRAGSRAALRCDMLMMRCEEQQIDRCAATVVTWPPCGGGNSWLCPHFLCQEVHAPGWAMRLQLNGFSYISDYQPLFFLTTAKNCSRYSRFLKEKKAVANQTAKQQEKQTPTLQNCFCETGLYFKSGVGLSMHLPHEATRWLRGPSVTFQRIYKQEMDF